ncbi:GntR family transcriptional regulator, gluconate operon transcriptional repressor [Amphibacillus marinus]|uniref:GntR family transcriptional regulator, gluconate operon transcriptional repressor n=1 Tax=Amphibacillus marinus TaxID=872970 RepID=A0A1H8MCK2_9BACI|nr:GntR family transcriptional regulator [Amphibacillus marinus]SEO14886.1 GntR family transcriptional regulator, gluconate operon transcriptional repressor [Amphibacillus marinus]
MVLDQERLYPEKWLVRASTGERIACEVRIQIIAGVIESGTVLSENKLANDFDVSRSPVREALKLLASENLVRLERMGAVVHALTEKHITEMYDVRILIETFVFERLVSQNVNPLIKELSKIVQMMKVAIDYSDADEFAHQDLLFHETIIQGIDHAYISMIWKNLRPIMESLILLSMRQRFRANVEDFSRVIENHQLYIDAINQKDRQLMNQSLHHNFDDVQQTIDQLWRTQQTLNKGEVTND